MKKIISFSSLALIMGLSFFSAGNTKFDDPLLSKDVEKTYIVTAKGDVNKDDAKTLKKNRELAMSTLAYALPEDAYEITNVYDTVLNGFSVKVNANYAKVVENLRGVSEVQPSHSYALPETDGVVPTAIGDKGEETKAMRLENYSAETMHAKADDIADAITSLGGTGTSQGGRKIAVGIIDTGLYLNQIEGSDARNKVAGTYNLNAAAFKDIDDADVRFTDADVQAKGFTTSSYYKRYNNKIFFTRDYNGRDNDVDPTKNGSNHGTHVASLAAANGDDFKGIAPNAQIAVLKVFPDNGGGAPTDGIIAALNDAAKLGLDTVNLSLGSDLYTSDDNKDSASFKAVKNAMDKGVIVNYAAGNAGKSSFSSSKTYSDWSRDVVETGILGSSAHYDEAANIVASSNNNRAFYDSILTVRQNGSTAENAVAYSDQAKPSATQQNLTDRPLAGLIPAGDTSVDLNYVVVPGIGKAADYNSIDAHGKVAVVNRGTTTFVQKIKQAANNGAIAMICINNDPSVTFNFSMAFEDYDPPIPVVFVFQNTKAFFGPAATEGVLTIGTNSVQLASDGNTISSFSTDGGDYNLDLGISFAAPGQNIMGAVSAIVASDGSSSGQSSLLRGYEYMSGTSMATPNLTGALALYLGEKTPDGNGALKTTAADYATVKALASAKAMSTADQLVDTTGTGTPNSPRMQGAGVVNVKSMLEADSYVTTVNEDLGGFTNTTQTVAELKNRGSLFVDGGEFTDSSKNYIEFEYTVHNDSNTLKTYTPNLSLLIPKLRINTTHEEYQEEEVSSRKDTIGYDENVDLDPNDPSTYPYGIGQITSSINDDVVTIPSDHQLTGTVTVPANSTATATAKVRIDDLHFEKDFETSFVEGFSGTLKEYFAKYFNEAGGNYVEGYLTLEEASGKDEERLTLPYLGFYGDYTKGAAVEDFDFERKDRKLYTSDLVDNYMRGLNEQYARKEAYTGSTLSAAFTAPTASEINSIGDMKASAKADGATYLSVVGKEGNHLYAGGANNLVATFFVLRAISSGTWQVSTEGGQKVSGGNISDLFQYSNTYTLNGGEMIKSWLVSTDSSYGLHRGYVNIDLSKVPEGEYNLSFNFTLKANGQTQRKVYPLSVDRTAPVLKSTELTTTAAGREQLNVVVEGAQASMTANTTATVLPKLVEGSKDLYKGTFNITDKWKQGNKIFIEASDYAHNVSTIIVKLDQLDFQISSTFFLPKHDFTIDEFSVRGNRHTYTVEVFDSASGNLINIKGDFTVYCNIKKGLDVSEIQVEVDSEEVTPDYDATTGVLAIHLTGEQSEFVINQKVLSQLKDDPVIDDDSSNQDSTVVIPDPTPEPKPEPDKKGCKGSIIATSATLGTLAVLAGVTALVKKHKEDK